MVFVAAPTTRSQAYAQEMARCGVAPEYVLVFGDAAPTHSSLPFGGSRVGGVSLPDLSIPLESTIRNARWPMEWVAAGHVNNAGVQKRLEQIQPSWILYSGFGGQLVGEEMLGLAPVIHAHAGWLPDERGSTTVYYGILEARHTAVSVLQLEKEIDAGPVFVRKRYPLPPSGVDVDHLWDPAIRADLMVSVLEQIGRTGALPEPIVQSGVHRQVRYVIHPVLKHLALLSLES